MPKAIRTTRLDLKPLGEHNDSFILELLNTDGWLQFIGDRNIQSLEDARKYIHTIQSTAHIDYWVVYRLEDRKRIGIITHIQRDYLPGPDIGFAFLDAYKGFGYAYEGASAIIGRSADTLYAIINPANKRSEKLLRKLGFVFERERVSDEKSDHIYAYQRDLKIL